MHVIVLLKFWNYGAKLCLNEVFARESIVHDALI